MKHHQLPDLLVLGALQSLLGLAEKILHQQHPTLADPLAFVDAMPPSLFAARLLARRCRELHDIALWYRWAVLDAVGQGAANDLF